MKRAAVLMLAVIAGGPSCSGRPCANLDYYGGPTWRVLDADRVDGVEGRRVIEWAHALVEECTGYKRPLPRIRLYLASAVIVKDTIGRWMLVNGTQRGGEVLYVRRGMSPADASNTVAHEIAHYVTRLGHPDIDPLLDKCGINRVGPPLSP